MSASSPNVFRNLGFGTAHALRLALRPSSLCGKMNKEEEKFESRMYMLLGQNETSYEE